LKIPHGEGNILQHMLFTLRKGFYENVDVINYPIYLRSRWFSFVRVLASILRESVNGLILPWGPFLESPGNFSDPESHSKISNLTITELFYSQKFQAYTLIHF